MKISGRRDYNLSIESIAMTDIIMNMFIFFFISFSLLYTFSPQRIQKLEVKLPTANSSSAIKDTKLANVTITNEGIIYLDKDLVNRKELKAKISSLIKENPDLAVVLRSDKLVRFKDVVAVLDVLNDIGVRNLNIAAVSGK